MSLSSISRHWRLLVLSLCLFCLPLQAAESLLIASGAGYRKPVTELMQAFEQQSGIRVDPFFGNMGQVLAQAGQSERIAVLFGDRSFLSKASSLSFSQWLPAGQGRLVLAWAKGRELASLQDLAGADFQRIALPDVQRAVYGKAGSEAVAAAGLQLGERLLPVATVPQVVAYLVSGEVDAGFINLTEALALDGRVGGYLQVDPALYGPIEIVGGVVAGREQLPGVAELATFLASDEARAILARHGL